MEEKTKQSTTWRVGLIVTLIVGIMLITIGILQPWQYTPQYSEEIARTIATNYLESHDMYPECPRRCGGSPNSPTSKAEYIGNGVWEVEFGCWGTSYVKMATVYVDERTGRVYY